MCRHYEKSVIWCADLIFGSDLLKRFPVIELFLSLWQRHKRCASRKENLHALNRSCLCTRSGGVWWPCYITSLESQALINPRWITQSEEPIKGPTFVPYNIDYHEVTPSWAGILIKLYRYYCFNIFYAYRYLTIVLTDQS